MNTKKIFISILITTIFVVSVSQSAHAGAGSDPTINAYALNISGASYGTNVFGDNAGITLSWRVSYSDLTYYNSYVKIYSTSGHNLPETSSTTCSSTICSKTFSSSIFNGPQTIRAKIYAQTSIGTKELLPSDFVWNFDVLDKTAPSLSGFSIVNNKAYKGDILIAFSAYDLNTVNPIPHVKIVHDDGSDDTSIASYSFTFHSNYYNLDDGMGTHIVTFKATDSYGNVNTAVFTIFVDRIHPTATILSPQNGDMGKCEVTVQIADFFQSYSHIKIFASRYSNRGYTQVFSDQSNPLSLTIINDCLFTVTTSEIYFNFYKYIKVIFYDETGDYDQSQIVQIIPPPFI